MHRFYLPPEQCVTTQVELSGREAHHAVRVLRLRAGDLVEVLDGAGRVLSCAVEEAGRDRVSLQVQERRFVPALDYEFTLLQGLPKGKLFEAIIQKSTELGARRIVPLITERVVSHLDHEEGLNKAARWRLVAVEAIKQCGSAWLPQVTETMTPKQWLERGEKPDLALFGSLQSKASHPRDHFLAFERAHQRWPRSISVWIGPEGDFSPAEAVLLEAANVRPVTLGRLVLRTETAAVYCLSVVNYELQARGG